jgi:hypothetical protein
MPLVAALTQDVLVHTWDLARAVGADDRLDPELCKRYFERLPSAPQALAGSGMFALPIDVCEAAEPLDGHRACRHSIV